MFNHRYDDIQSIMDRNEMINMDHAVIAEKLLYQGAEHVRTLVESVCNVALSDDTKGNRLDDIISLSNILLGKSVALSKSIDDFWVLLQQQRIEKSGLQSPNK